MKIYLIRHLLTPYNKKGVLQGSIDISIQAADEKTLAQIEEQKELLLSIDFDHVFCSNLNRTKETAALYNYHEPEVDSLINELDFGKYEGEPKEIFYMDVGPLWYEDPRTFVLGETMVDFEARLIKFINKYKSKNNLLAFTHGGVMRALKAIHRDGNIKAMNTFKVDNNQLEVLEF